MSVIQSLHEKAKSNRKRIVFPETQDQRVIAAIKSLIAADLVECVAIGRDDALEIPAPCESISLANVDLRDQCVEQYVHNRAHKGLCANDASIAIESNPLLFAALLVKTGFVDGCVAGSMATTADVLRAALHGVGTAENTRLVSSFFLMELGSKAMTYADCGVVPDPNADELAEIAIASAESHLKLTGETPRVALLSFSTKGSAKHPRVEKVQRALEIVKSKRPELAIDGELQFDAAWHHEIGKRKAPGSEVAGQANVFVFPDLDSGNIAYKITERLAGATALGPLIQGLAKPCMDLSRGCDSDDIVDVAVIASVLSQ